MMSLGCSRASLIRWRLTYVPLVLSRSTITNSSPLNDLGVVLRDMLRMNDVIRRAPAVRSGREVASGESVGEASSSSGKWSRNGNNGRDRGCTT